MAEIPRITPIPYTKITREDVKKHSIVLAVKENIYDVLTLRLPKVVLSQNPSETLHIIINIHRKLNLDKRYLYEVHPTIIFNNDLHEFSQNFAYEVLLERFQSEIEPNERLLTLFERRVSGELSFKVKRFITPEWLNSDNLNLYIRRHNLNYCKIEATQFIDFKWLHQEVPPNIKLSVKGQIILVHKFVLTYKSEVFKAMFNSKMTETISNVVTMEDFDIDVVQKMIDFMYTGQVDDISKIRYRLFEAAHRYQLHELCHCCIEYILFYSDYENIAETLKLADLYDIDELKSSMINFVETHQEQMNKEPSYQDYMCHTMKINNVVDRLLFGKLNNVENVYEAALDFIGQHFCEMKDDDKFNELFQSDPGLIIIIFHYYCEKYATKTSR